MNDLLAQTATLTKDIFLKIKSYNATSYVRQNWGVEFKGTKGRVFSMIELSHLCILEAPQLPPKKLRNTNLITRIQGHKRTCFEAPQLQPKKLHKAK